RRDPHERVRREHLVGREDAAPVEAESDEQRRACERGGLEESTARDHAEPPGVAAASWRAARIRTYVAHRQTLPDIAVSMSASDGRGVSASSAIAGLIWPDWQCSLCAPSSLRHAACRACAPWPEAPSIVT